MNQIYSLGVDFGGTWVRVIALDEYKKVVRHVQRKTISLQKLPSFLKAQIRKWRAQNLKFLVIGARGVWSKNERKKLNHSLKSLARNILVFSDVEMAYRSAFRNSQGIILIGGTGSIAYGKDKTGKFARAGGLGPKKGDEGSGFWIGKQFLGRTYINIYMGTYFCSPFTNSSNLS